MRKVATMEEIAETCDILSKKLSDSEWDQDSKDKFEAVEDESRLWISQHCTPNPEKIPGFAPVLDWYSATPIPIVFEHKAATIALEHIDASGGLFISEWKLAMLQAVGKSRNAAQAFVYTVINGSDRTVLYIEIDTFMDRYMTWKRRSPRPGSNGHNTGWKLKSNLWQRFGTYTV